MEVSSRIVADRVDANGDLFPRAVLEKAIEAAPGIPVYDDFGGRKVGRVTSARLDDTGRLIFSMVLLPSEQLPIFTVPPPEVVVAVRAASSHLSPDKTNTLSEVKFLYCCGRERADSKGEEEAE